MKIKSLSNGGYKGFTRDMVETVLLYTLVVEGENK